MARSSYSRAGVNHGKVGEIHSSLARELGRTFAFRAGKSGAPLMAIGHYAGLIDLGGDSVLALHTDGVGSKVLIAQRMGRFDTVGIDCVAMTVNDLICLGAEPVALLDYVALEKENGSLVSELTKGLSEGARLSAAAIVGGETAILGDMVKGLHGNGFDLVSMGVGLVKKSEVIDGLRIREGDAVIGVESSGLHSNGYTLVRKILGRLPLNDRPGGLGTTLGDALLAPTRIYVVPTLAATRSTQIHGIAHITGGAFSKLARLVGSRALMFDLELPPPPPIFKLLQLRGGVTDREMYSTFNMGIGLCLVLPESEIGEVARPFRREGFLVHHLGQVRKGKGIVVNGVRLR